MSGAISNNPLAHLLQDNEALTGDFERSIAEEAELSPKSFTRTGSEAASLDLKVRYVSKGAEGIASALVTKERRINRYREVTETFHKADTNRRQQMLADPATAIVLKAVVRASYRPAYRFNSNYLLRGSIRQSKIDYQINQLWPEFLANVLNGYDWPNWVTTPAKATCRLALNQTLSGSAFQLGHAALLTAYHVIENGDNAPIVPDFGILPADRSARCLAPVLAKYPPNQTLPTCPDFAILNFNGESLSEDLRTAGLISSIEPFSPEELQGCFVAVVGHPSAELRYNSAEDFDLVFGDGIAWEKRFMPGRLSWLQNDPAGLLIHDCSTTGGASGSPVFFLADADRKSNNLTGKVIGIHIGGSPRFENRAIPIPLVNKIITDSGL